MIPFLLIPIIIAIVGGVAAGTTYIAMNWRSIFGGLTQKKLAVLGPSKSGKTTFYNALKAIADENKEWKATDNAYFPTEAKMKISPITSKTHYFYCLFDVNGNQQAERGTWKEVLKSADIIFYCFDINALKVNKTFTYDDIKYSYNEIIQADIKYIIGNNSTGKPIILLGTHADLLPKFKTMNENSRAAFKESFKEKHLAFLNRQNSKMIIAIGSLVDYQSAEQLLGNAFENLNKMAE